MGCSWSQAETREERERDPREAADHSRQHQQRQINLLDHIDSVQDEVSHRMDFIERELDGKTPEGVDLGADCVRNLEPSYIEIHVEDDDDDACVRAPQ